MGGEQPRVEQQRVGAGSQPRGEMVGAVAGERQQGVPQPVRRSVVVRSIVVAWRVVRHGPRHGPGRAPVRRPRRTVRLVLHAGRREGRDRALGQQVQELRQGRGPLPPLRVHQLGIRAGQRAGRTGQPDDPGLQVEPGRVPPRGGHVGGDEGEPDRRPEPDRGVDWGVDRGAALPAGQARPAGRLPQHGDRGVELEALRLRQQGLQQRAPGHSSTRAPVRGAKRATAPSRPRRTTVVRTNEFAVACRARKRSSTEASR